MKNAKKYKQTYTISLDKESINRLIDLGINNKTLMQILEGEGKTFINRNKYVIFMTNQIKDITDENETEKILKTIQLDTATNSIKDDPIVAIDFDQQNRAWIAYQFKGFCSFSRSSGNIKNYSVIATNSNRQITVRNITDMLFLKGKLWISTEKDGILVYDTLSNTIDNYFIDNESYVNDLLRDDNEDIIICDNSGIAKFDTDKMTGSRLKPKPGGDNKDDWFNCYCIMKDKTGAYWVGSAPGKLKQSIRNKGFNAFHLNSKNEIVSSILKDRNGNIWLGYFFGGIDVFDEDFNLLRTFRHNPANIFSLGDETVFKIFEDSDGNIWVGTYRGGLQMYDHSIEGFHNFDPVNVPGQIDRSDVRDIAEDSKGNIWCTSHGHGVFKIHPDKQNTEHFRGKESGQHYPLISDWSWAVYIDNEDNVWIGSNKGLSLITENGNRIKNFSIDSDSSLLYSSSNDIRYIMQDNNKNLWLGSDFGLFYFNPRDNSIQKFYEKDGLANNSICCIAGGVHENLWISTIRGMNRMYISRTDKISLTNDSLSPGNEYSLQTFDQSDGVHSEGFYSNSFYQSSDGQLFFGGNGGITYFYPDSIKLNQNPPKIIISKFKLFNKTVEPGDETGILASDISRTRSITLAHDQNIIYIEYFALNFEQSWKNQYAYYMKGFEESWNYVGTKREATYTNLDPGEYTFHIKASNNDGIWNEKGTSLNIIITPPFWQTKTAFLIYALFIILAVWFARHFIVVRERTKLEIKKMQEVDTLKMQFFTNISHELKTPLTLILDPLKKIIEQGTHFDLNKNFYQFKLMFRNASRLQRLINQILDVRKLETGNMEMHVAEYDIIAFCQLIVKSFEDYAYQRKIQIHFKSSPEFLMVWFDADMIEKVVNNLLSNALKFIREEGIISVSISKEINPSELTDKVSSEYVKIVVSDTGIGIPKEKTETIFERFGTLDIQKYDSVQGTGIGLSLVKDFIELHQGKIFVESNTQLDNNPGSSFIWFLPLGSKHFSNDQFIKAGSTDNSYPISYIEVSDEQKDKEREFDNFIQGKEKTGSLLIIDDDADIVEYIKAELSEDYIIEFAYDGNSGLKKALEKIPDIVISDVMMPGIDGFKLCETLKRDERTSHIPVILLTAKTTEEHQMKGLGTGADDYITKPFHIDLLAVRCRNLINSRKTLRQKFGKELNFEIPNLTPTSTDEKFITKAVKIVEDNLDDPNLDVERFTAEIGVSRAQLYRKMKAVTDLSVKEFIKLIRMKKASTLLLNDQFNVSEVAHIVGFTDLSYFARCFKNQFGLSPSNYKNTRKSSGS